MRLQCTLASMTRKAALVLILAACAAPKSEPSPVATASIGSVSPPPPATSAPAPAKSDFVAVDHPPAPPAGPPHCGPNAVPRPAPAKRADRPVGAPDPSSIPNAPPLPKREGLTAAVAQCIVDVVKTAEFEPPDRRVAINIPVRFVQAKDVGAP
jgi:hypothetical protein